MDALRGETRAAGPTKFDITVGVIADLPESDEPVLRVYPVLKEGDDEWRIMSGAQLYTRGLDGWRQFAAAFQKAADEIVRLIEKYERIGRE